MKQAEEIIELKAYFKANKIKQCQIADFFGVSSSAVSQWFSGRTKLPKRKLDKLRQLRWILEARIIKT